jgi:hypothetical protein
VTYVVESFQLTGDFILHDEALHKSSPAIFVAADKFSGNCDKRFSDVAIRRAVIMKTNIRSASGVS